MPKGFVTPHRPAAALAWVVVFAWLFVLAEVLFHFSYSLWLAIFALVAAVLTALAFWPRRVQRQPGDLACSFCSKSQREVHKLVAGENVYICDECIRLSDDILLEDVPRPADRVVVALQGALQRLLPVGEAVRLVDAWSAIDDSPAGRTSTARFARAGGNFTAAVHAVDGLSDGERGAALLELASLRIVELEDASAIELLDRVDAASLTDHERIELRVVAAYARYDQGDRSESLAAARAAVAELEGTGWSASMSQRLSAVLDVRAALTKHEVASAEALARAAAEQHNTALTWELLAHVLELRGDAGAHEARLRAKDRCDAECARGRRVRAGSAAPFR